MDDNNLQTVFKVNYPKYTQSQFRQFFFAVAEEEWVGWLFNQI